MRCLTNNTQVSLFDLYENLSSTSYQSPRNFFNILRDNFDISAFIPDSFKSAYYSNIGRDRNISLESMLSALLIMHFLNIPTVSLLCHFLTFSKELRMEFCGFHNSIPSESVISKFKSSFSDEIQNLFQNLVTASLPIFSEIDEDLPDDHPLKGASKTLIYDTSGVKPVVKENNPKFLSSKVKAQKNFAKTIDNPNFNPHAAAVASMPKEASCNNVIKLDYLNGHFAYFYKFGLLTNGFGVPLHINFFDDLDLNLDETNALDPPAIKQASDSASLKPILDNFLKLYPKESFTYFMADAEFDSFANYSFLKESGFSKVFIPINPRSAETHQVKKDFPLDENGIPLCPNDLSLKFKSDGSCKGKNRSLRFKFICPYSKRVATKLVSTCSEPCSGSDKVPTCYMYPDQDFRMYPGLLRDSDEFINRYKIRAVIERTYSSLKSNYCVTQPKSLNLKSIRSDIFLAASTKVITAILAYALHKPEYMKNTSKLLKLSA